MKETKSKSEIIDALYEAIELHGLARVLKTVFGNSLSVTIAFTCADCDKKIEEIEFSVRAMNALKRTGIFTIGAVIDAVADNSIMKIKNLGIKTRNEIKTHLLQISYNSSTPYERRQLLSTLLDKSTTC